eukprot:NP_001263581.1 40S ribosomal protein S6 [Caenorhabditis elegans]
MRLNFAYPATGLQKSFEVDEEKKLRLFFEKRMSQEVAIDALGDEWKGQSCYRERKNGERKRKSVRGCIVDANMSALSLVIVKKGDGEIEGLTDSVLPRKLGPKRASKIRKLFNLTKHDDVTKYVITHDKTFPDGVTKTIAPKIQRLITPARIARKKYLLRQKRNQKIKMRDDAAAYHKLLAKYSKEEHDAKIARRRSSASHHSESEVKKTSKK